MKNIIIIIAVIAVLLGGVIWIARPSLQVEPVASAVKNTGTLTVQDSDNYDFGEISMAAGEVKHQFKIKNAGIGTVTVNKIYTSCMCTTASLMMAGNKQFGPYGMPGHGFIPKISQDIKPNEEATVEVIFDPAAHGPSGVGRIQRSITIESNDGESVQLQFAAVVTP